jgi:hypothetical protein
VRCLSHPKGRHINRRPENALDLEGVLTVALEERVALEVTASQTVSTLVANTSAARCEPGCRLSAQPTGT